jgi:hypothetical protein
VAGPLTASMSLIRPLATVNAMTERRRAILAPAPWTHVGHAKSSALEPGASSDGSCGSGGERNTRCTEAVGAELPPKWRATAPFTTPLACRSGGQDEFSIDSASRMAIYGPRPAKEFSPSVGLA